MSFVRTQICISVYTLFLFSTVLVEDYCTTTLVPVLLVLRTTRGTCTAVLVYGTYVFYFYYYRGIKLLLILYYYYRSLFLNLDPWGAQSSSDKRKK